MPKKTIMKIKNINLIEDCQDYIGLDLLVLKEDLPQTGSDEYYWYELIGSNVINSDGIELGKVVEIFTSGENEVLVIKNKSDNKEIFIPFLKDTIINFEDKKLTVRWDNEL
jgi:16S rRNA processing protein RimM